MSISVSERAVDEIKRAAAKRQSTPKGLRVGIRGGGCTGFSYLFEWSDKEPRPEDNVLDFEEGRVRVFVDGFSLQYLNGVTIDYVSSMQGSGFTFTNPNATGGCGCGSSFTA